MAVDASAVTTIESSTAADISTLMTAAQNVAQFSADSFDNLGANGVTITGGTSIDVTDLNNAISGVNTVASGTVDLVFSADNNTTTINGGTATEFATTLLDNKTNNKVSFSGINLTVDSGGVTTAQANNLTNATTGTVTATVSDGDLDTLSLIHI